MSGRGDERAFKGCTAAVVAAVRIPMARVVAVVDDVDDAEDSDEEGREWWRESRRAMEGENGGEGRGQSRRSGCTG